MAWLDTGTETFRLRTVANPFDPWRSSTVRELPPGQGLLRYLEDIEAEDIPGLGLRAWVNGREVSKDRLELIIPRAGDLVDVCAEVRNGGGGGGKDPLVMVGMLALAIVAPMAGAWLTTTALGAAFGTFTSATAWNIVAGLGAGLTMMAGGAVISAITPAAAASSSLGATSTAIGSDTGFEANSSYGISVTSNPTEAGATAPFLFGTFRVTPRVISWHLDTDGDNQIIKILYLAADHPVESITDVEINDSPSSDFPGIAIETRLGALDQAVIADFALTRTEISVGTSILDATVTRSVPSDMATMLGVGILFPGGLYVSNVNGKPVANSALVTIEYRLSGASSWTTMVSESVSGAQQNPKRRFWTVTVPEGEYEVRATATHDLALPGWSSETSGYNTGDLIMVSGTVYEFIGSGPSGSNTAAPGGSGNPHWREVSSSRIVHAVQLEHIQYGISDAFIYPGCSLLSVSIPGSEQLSGWPKVRALTTRGTIRVWDGEQWADKPSDNPAWACWDMLVSDVYGPGVDKERLLHDEFAEWADYCDEKGYTVNIYFDGQAMDLSTALGHVSMAGRGRVLQKGSLFGVAVDRPRTAVHKFGMGNIIKKSRQGKTLGLRDRANVIEFTCFPAANNYNAATYELRDPSFDYSTREIIRRQMTLYWCTDVDAGYRYAWMLLKKNRYQKRTETVRASVDAVGATLFDCASLSHDTPYYGTSGRVLFAGEQSVTLDREVTLEPGTVYYVEARNGKDEATGIDTMEEIQVAPVTETTTTDTLALVQDWTAIPDPYAPYSFGPAGQHCKVFEIASVSRSASMEREIDLLEYHDEVYDEDDLNIPAIPATSSGLALVAGLSVTEVWRLGKDGSGQSVACLAWRGVSPDWSVYYRQGSGPWIKAGATRRPEFEITGLVDGAAYTFAVSPGAVEAGLTVTLTALGKSAPPMDVTGFRASQRGNTIVLDWDHNPDWDFGWYEAREGNSFEAGTIIRDADGEVKATATWRPPLDGTYTFWIKAFDDSGNPSKNAASVQISVQVESTLNIVRNVDEATLPTPWPGTKTNMAVNGTTGTLDLVSAAAGDGVYVSPVYEVASLSTITLRAVAGYSSTLDPAVLTDQGIATRTDQTFPEDTDQDITSLAAPSAFFRVSPDGEEWGDWTAITGTVDVQALAYQFKWVVSPDNPALDFSFSSLRHLCDGPEIEKRIFGQAVAAGGTTFDLGPEGLGISFLTAYDVGVTRLGSAFLTDTVDIHGLDSFTVHLFNSSGAAVSGTVNLTIRGF